MASDMIENYEGHPAFQFFRDFDADCDWSEEMCIRDSYMMVFPGVTESGEVNTKQVSASEYYGACLLYTSPSAQSVD